MGLTLWSYRYSVYGRIARMALHMRGLEATRIEVDPFADPPDPVLAGVSPFGLVPVLDHDGFVLTETSVIIRYLATAFPGMPLIPDDPRAAARMAQCIAVIDNHGYWPMVRQVFAQSVFRPMMGDGAGDPDLIATGLTDATPVLDLLDRLAGEGLVLNGTRTLADLHLAPMIGYFTMAAKGADAVAARPALQGWWDGMQDDPAYRATDPGLATIPG